MEGQMNGKNLKELALKTFGTEKITQEQLDYLLTLTTPSLYMLKHNLIRGHNITFSIPNRDKSKAQAHRP